MTANLNTASITANYTPTTRTIGERGFDVINVRDFGAVGDGVTDDLAAIQAAVDWCVSGTATFPDLVTTAPTTSGTTLTFASVPNLVKRFCNGNAQTYITDFTDAAAIATGNTYGIAAGTTTITLNNAVTATVETGDAIRIMSQRRGIIYFPPGNYNISASIEFSIYEVKYIHFLGAAGAMITGSFNDALLKNGNSANAQQSICIIEGIDFIQSGTSGKCIEIASNLCGTVRNCRIVATGSSGVGVSCFTGNDGGASQVIQNCVLSGAGYTGEAPNTVPPAATNIGVLAGNAVSIVGCDTVGWGTSVRHSNQGLFFYGGRHENNGLVVKLGWRPDGADHISSGVFIGGLSVESCGTVIDSRNSNSITISGISTQANVVGQSNYGIVIDGGHDITIQSVCLGGNGFDTMTAGYLIGHPSSGQTIARISFANCSCECPATTKWDFTNASVTSMAITNCDGLVNGGILVADKPTAPYPGTILPFSDANSTTSGAALAGGGANLVSAVYANATTGWILL
jgi:hypothetical protein